MVMPMTASSAGQTTDTKIIASIDAAARANSLSNKILSRLLWVESRFQTTVISPTGAQGIAQFMPATAADRGVANPFVAAQAIPHAAKFLADLDLRFGNIGLAVAAYNAGSGRIAKWLAGTGHLPKETQGYVLAITGHTAEEWAASGFAGVLGRPIACRSCGLLLSRHAVRFGDRDIMLPILERSGEPLPGFEQSGQPLPTLKESGRPLPILRDSGRPITAGTNRNNPLRIIAARLP